MNRTVSRNALIKRVRRALWRWNWRLEISPGQQADREGGRYCLVDSKGNLKGRHYVLEDLAKDLWVLRDGEVVDDGHDDDRALDFPTGIQILLQIDAALAEKDQLVRTRRRGWA